MKVAIVCDWLTGEGGAERVVLELHKMFPHAPIYTSQYDPKSISWFGGADVRTNWLQKLPKSWKKFMAPLRARAFSHLDLSEYDLVISSSGAEAKGVRTSPNTLHVNYCHAPTHYYWSRYDDYIENPGFGFFDPLARVGLRLLLSPMRRWDKKAAARPDYMLANSTHIQKEIKKYYGRDSVVVHPPVEVDYFKPDKSTERSGFVALGRQTPYKKIDLAVSACTKLNLPLTVIGDGPERKKLESMAGPSVKFVGFAKRAEVRDILQKSAGFIFPGLDDFGISAVEALAAGTPVIAYKAGGALDYIHPGKNGLFFDKQTVQALEKALDNFAKHKFSSDEVAKSAQQFSPKSFRENIQQFLKEVLDGKS